MGVVDLKNTGKTYKAGAIEVADLPEVPDISIPDVQMPKAGAPKPIQRRSPRLLLSPATPPEPQDEKVPEGPKVPKRELVFGGGEWVDRRPSESSSEVSGLSREEPSDVSSVDSSVARGLAGWIERRMLREGIARPIPQRSRIGLRAEVPIEGGRLLSGHHLVVPGDEGRDPVMGAVHMVHFGGNPHEKHFLFDVDGDVNEGHKRIVAKSRRGPFAQHTGASTVMDRSSHVLYRARQGTMEISVKRGVLGTEVDLLISKLAMHRTSVPMSSVVFVKGRKRYRLGSLDSLDFAKLREMIAQCLKQYKTCGILLIEAKPGTGALHRPHVHQARFKSNARRGKGPFRARQ
jgi:hypothetical protein